MSTTVVEIWPLDQGKHPWYHNNDSLKFLNKGTIMSTFSKIDSSFIWAWKILNSVCHLMQQQLMSNQ